MIDTEVIGNATAMVYDYLAEIYGGNTPAHVLRQISTDLYPQIADIYKKGKSWEVRHWTLADGWQRVDWGVFDSEEKANTAIKLFINSFNLPEGTKTDINDYKAFEL